MVYQAMLNLSASVKHWLRLNPAMQEATWLTKMLELVPMVIGTTQVLVKGTDQHSRIKVTRPVTDDAPHT